MLSITVPWVWVLVGRFCQSNFSHLYYCITPYCTHYCTMLVLYFKISFCTLRCEYLWITFVQNHAFFAEELMQATRGTKLLRKKKISCKTIQWKFVHGDLMQRLHIFSKEFLKISLYNFMLIYYLMFCFTFKGAFFFSFYFLLVLLEANSKSENNRRDWFWDVIEWLYT